VLAALGITAGACVVWALTQRAQPVNYGIKVVRTFPHDPQAYTQGLAFHEGCLYEGTGKYGESTLREVDLESGRVLRSHALDARLFGEGITPWKDRILQLTWKNETGIVYDQANFRELSRFAYDGEGWGITHDGTHLIVSDGSSTLRFLDPQTFRVVRRLLVLNRGRRLGNLNELEYIRGEIYANIWYQDYIVKISPRTGDVTGWIDLRGLLPQRMNRDQVLNGIAYDEANDRLFVTGKNWPKLFQISLVPR
jgi:glutamine cyclotransferase